MNQPRSGYAVFINTYCDGAVPAISDGQGCYVVFQSEMEAQREIVDNALTRLQEFLDGNRDFDDAITVEEYVIPVNVNPDGSITDASGKQFGPNAD